MNREQPWPCAQPCTAPSSAGTGRAVPRTGPQRGSTPSPRAKSLPNGSNIAFHFPMPPSAAGVIGAWCFRVVWVPAWCWGLTSMGRPHTWDSWRGAATCQPPPPSPAGTSQHLQAAVEPGCSDAQQAAPPPCRHPAQRDPGLEGKEASSSRSWCLLLPPAAEAAAREEPCSCSGGIRAQICLLQGLFLGRMEQGKNFEAFGSKREVQAQHSSLLAAVSTQGDSSQQHTHRLDNYSNARVREKPNPSA